MRQRDLLVGIAVEQRRGAFHVEGLLAGKLGERRARQPQRASQQLIVERAVLLEPRDHCLAHVEQRQAGELGIEVSGRLRQIVGPQELLRVHHLLRHLISARDDDDEDARAVERHELDALEDRRMAVGHREAHMPCRARDDARDAGQQIVHQRRRAGVLAQLVLDVRRGTCRTAALEQEIHEDSIPAIGGDASRRGVWLVEVAALLQVRQHTPHRGGRHAQPALLREHLRRNRLAGLDVLTHERRQQAARPIGQFVGTHCQAGA